MYPHRLESRPRGTSLYVHVPFCTVKCGYCDFTSYVVEDPTAHDRFLDALERELAAAAVPGIPRSVFIGGGTPSYLTPERLRRLLAIIAGRCDIASVAEVTMEANPESVTAEKAEVALAGGVNRFSMGVQSFDAARLRFLDRAHDPERVGAAVLELRSAGVTNLSLDMIYGLPGQTVDEWRRDLDAALQQGPDHLSCYNLTFEQGRRLYRDLAQGTVGRNDEEVDRQMFDVTRTTLVAAGFDAYEISNFAGRGGACHHNDHYWLQGDYVGVGPGASSHRAGHRATNLKALEAWADSALAGLPPVATAEVLSPRQRIGEALWLGVRRRDGIDLEQVEDRIRYPVRSHLAAVFERQILAGWIAVAGSVLTLTAEGLHMADAVGRDYLAGGEE